MTRSLFVIHKPIEYSTGGRTMGRVVKKKTRSTSITCGWREGTCVLYEAHTRTHKNERAADEWVNTLLHVVLCCVILCCVVLYPFIFAFNFSFSVRRTRVSARVVWSQCRRVKEARRWRFPLIALSHASSGIVRPDARAIVRAAVAMGDCGGPLRPLRVAKRSHCSHAPKRTYERAVVGQAIALVLYL